MKLVTAIRPGSSKNLWPFLLVCFYVLAILIHQGYYPLNGDEPRRAVVALEMRHSGNFIAPTTMGWDYYSKPPVYNWLISLSMFLTGSEDEIAVRLPSLLTMILWGFCIYKLLRRFIPHEVAALSSLFFLTSFDIFFWGLNNGGEIDIFYSFITYLQVIFIFIYNQQKRWLHLFVASYLFCAIGFLTKGFPSVLFQILTLLAVCVFNRSVKWLLKWQHLAGVSLFVLLVGGYFYAYSFHASTQRFVLNLLKESLDKSIVGDYPERLLRKVIEYPFSFLKILLPWSLLLLMFFKKRHFNFWSHPFIRFSLLFICFNIPVYWFTGHPRMRYSYVFAPFFMTILAFIFYEFRQAQPEFVKRLSHRLAIFFFILFGSVLLLPVFMKINYAWYFICLLLIVLFVLLYKNAISHTLWYLGVGLIVSRFLYAALYLPQWYGRMHLDYKREMAIMAAKNNYQPVSIYNKPDTLDLSIDLKFIRFHYDSIPTIPYLTFQIPYYYYRHSGHLVAFDTVMRPNSNYISFRSLVSRMPVNIIYSFRDRNYEANAEIVLCRSNETVSNLSSDPENK